VLQVRVKGCWRPEVCRQSQDGTGKTVVTGLLCVATRYVPEIRRTRRKVDFPGGFVFRPFTGICLSMEVHGQPPTTATRLWGYLGGTGDSMAAKTSVLSSTCRARSYPVRSARIYQLIHILRS
jgi:hypothetical protein